VSLSHYFIVKKKDTKLEEVPGVEARTGSSVPSDMTVADKKTVKALLEEHGDADDADKENSAEDVNALHEEEVSCDFLFYVWLLSLILEKQKLTALFFPSLASDRRLAPSSIFLKLTATSAGPRLSSVIKERRGLKRLTANSAVETMYFI
jgi:hypothetical protein